MKTKKHGAIVLSSGDEKKYFQRYIDMLKDCPVPDEERLDNMGLFVTSKNMARMLFFYEIYRKILNSHGAIVEFGVRWGQTLSVLTALRGILEPFNRHRKIIGFDTFSGFVGLGKKDGAKCKCHTGSFSVSKGYEEYLTGILDLQEKLNPMGHITKFELVKGDATKTIPAYFKAHPETIVSLAFFDFDIYQPTKAALKAIKPRLCKGSILVFDELSDEYFPGETVAVKEILGLNNVKVERLPMTARLSYIQIK